MTPTESAFLEREDGKQQTFDLENEVDLIMGTHGSRRLGHIIAGPANVISWIKHLAGSMMFSASLPPPWVPR